MNRRLFERRVIAWLLPAAVLMPGGCPKVGGADLPNEF